MAELSGVVRPRTAGVALLVSPGDKAAVVELMRISACMWGGRYNPIIPVFRKPPKAWPTEFPADVTGLEIGRGYIQFFEPDAFVEAQRGLLERANLGSLRGYICRGRVLTLDELLAPEPHKDWADLHLGLPVEGFFSKFARSVLRHIRVTSKHELKERIMAGIDDINRHPVIHTWSYKFAEAA
jgi:hypothetical protein